MRGILLRLGLKFDSLIINQRFEGLPLGWTCQKPDSVNKQSFCEQFPDHVPQAKFSQKAHLPNHRPAGNRRQDVSGELVYGHWRPRTRPRQAWSSVRFFGSLIGPGVMCGLWTFFFVSATDLAFRDFKFSWIQRRFTVSILLVVNDYD